MFLAGRSGRVVGDAEVAGAAAQLGRDPADAPVTVGARSHSPPPRVGLIRGLTRAERVHDLLCQETKFVDLNRCEGTRLDVEDAEGADRLLPVDQPDARIKANVRRGSNHWIAGKSRVLCGVFDDRDAFWILKRVSAKRQFARPRGDVGTDARPEKLNVATDHGDDGDRSGTKLSSPTRYVVVSNALEVVGLERVDGNLA